MIINQPGEVAATPLLRYIHARRDAGARLRVLVSRAANLGNVAYEMVVFANRAGEVISPQLIEELKVSVGL